MKKRYSDYQADHLKVEEAVACCLSNPSSVLETEISNIKNKIDSISIDNWQDSSATTFKVNKNTVSLKLGIIMTSIANVFRKSEQIYDLLNQQLENFKIIDKNYQDTLDKEPKQSDYKKKVEENGNLVERNDTSAYREAHSNWESVLENIKIEGNNCITQIEKYILLLDEINALNITMTATMPYISATLPDVYSPNEFSYNETPVLNYSFECTILEGTGINQEAAEAIMKEFGGSVAVKYYADSGKIGIRYNQGADSIWNSKSNRVDGFNVHESGCGLLSLAGVITSVLSNQAGKVVCVTPTQLARELSNYAATNASGGNLTKYMNNSTGLLGDYHALGEAVSEIYGVSVVVNSTGSLEYNNYENIMDKDTSIMYSCANQSHINSVYAVKGNGQVYECDTGGGKIGFLTNGTTYDPAKRAIYVSSSFGVSDGYLTRNGEIVTSDIGPVNSIISGGKTYDLSRSSDGSYKVTSITESDSKYMENLKNNS